MKRLIFLAIAFVWFAVQTNAGTRQDIPIGGGTTPRAFSQATSTGAIAALNDATYEVDALGSYGAGVNYNATTINTAIKAIGITNNVTLVLRPGSWVMNTNITIPSNIVLKIVSGASIRTTGYSLTINGRFEAGSYPVFSGNGMLVFGEGAVDVVYPEWWGAKGDGTVDCTSAINSAIASLSRGTVKFGGGTYRIVNTVTLNKHRVNLVGQGPQATIISYTPMGAGTAIYVYKSGGACVQNMIKGFGIQSSDTHNFTKVAIQCRNVEELKIEDVAINPWNGNRASIGFQSRGKHMVSLFNCSIRADICVSIEDNPESTIDIDHYNFHNTYLIADIGSCVQVADGVNLTNVTFDGYQAWAPKTYGFYWRDTTTGGISANLSFNNVRIEQETDPGAYLFYIQHKIGLYNLLFENIYGGLISKGFYLRKCLHTTLKNIIYYNVSKNEALNADISVHPLVLINCFWQAGSTFSVGNLIKRFSSAEGSYNLPSNAIYGISYYQSAGGDDCYYPWYDGVQVNNVAELSFTETLADGAYTKYINISPGSPKFVRTEVSAYVSATRAVEGGTSLDYIGPGAAMVSLGGTSRFSVSDKEGAVCVLRSPTNVNLYRIRNRLGTNAVVHVKVWVTY
jgi:hypothetical protein